MLAIGYAVSYPTPRNIIVIVMTLPFMVWRIEQEERHLREDPTYRSYESRVRYRLVPGLI
jgi:protein-S-isoprenylcysteine O-methyltransferase Ste14